MAKLEPEQNLSLLLMIFEGIIQKDIGMIQGALDLGADVTMTFHENRRIGRKGTTVLHLAGWLNADKDIIHTLVMAAGSADVPDVNGCSPLHDAVQRASLSSIEALLAAGASPVFLSKNKKTPVDAAQENLTATLPAVLKMLATIKPDADLLRQINKQDVTGNSQKDVVPTTKTPVKLIRPISSQGETKKDGARRLKLD